MGGVGWSDQTGYASTSARVCDGSRHAAAALLHSFDGEDDFAAAMTASSYVPGLMGLRPWLRVRGAAAFDGYLSLWRTWLPQNYLYIGFLPTLPVHRIGEHSLRAFEYDSLPGWLSKLSQVAPWNGAEWADAAYARGRRDAETNRLELRRRILSFLRS
ncbi:hypothetical protein EMIHUDRAFT_453875 [Emiliania huxleyi CCMP1516]|uniref:Uncharacterized protein n=2 Tax=Emiliania huxleyi TaxID=2903 RepID=A0A0D3HZA8_EMIH1|nr:hypothetical protein EMIHUDRAFT_453875 [Emiliania huxleyi CCMP1516]EOD04343.1 hypothetical protein EMIHUDRAFT_453875 [Emiliania huxleyi CCMP1516]|eukprot:XP_005756772.1 hypothetical protein EMIHUDRAFT_453875 [Emiliania huxleyi CCMP1516]